MNTIGIDTAGLWTGYGTGKTESKAASKDFSKEIFNVTNRNTAAPAVTLHGSDAESGDIAVSAWADCVEGVSVTVYKTQDFNPENPIYKVKMWDAAGNVTERMVDISKVNPKSCDAIDMYAYSSYLADSGECPNALQRFVMAEANYRDTVDGKSLFQKVNWLDIIKDIMKMQYDAGNLKGYLEYKNFWDYLNQTNYVRISPEALSGMEQNPVLKNKVLNAIEEFCSPKGQDENGNVDVCD